MGSKTVDPPPSIMDVWNVIQGIRNGTIKSYCILADSESLLALNALSMAMGALATSMTTPMAESDPVLKATIQKQFLQLLQLTSEIQSQLLQNSQPKPSVPES
jgi:hypothetical protein